MENIMICFNCKNKFCCGAFLDIEQKINEISGNWNIQISCEFNCDEYTPEE